MGFGLWSSLWGTCSPPPNVTSLAWIGQAQWILVLWGYWIDRHRRLAVINDRREVHTLEKGM
ncbi:MAG: hypothetical protein OIN90_05410 [Candidatus Methanoperedens sp.]|uniref:hypothetical protein n=1 Tax=Candidatus Methanoperedens sp. BLZ2 TaxID=2035255 RepID=UPI0011445451|nr:hypothetical protein [Candidatus Methanoperedens sp. BLZ2]KAB2946764.1 MAG: hypothetical protein F9K14_06315 [Candidatus Methanoperedens sp.]MBZ0175814.1 hypothetical protein [Candidatus Methanoperedens nitroreducens]MCX9079272.1 hypothetical protein [Candidatus Methanoperedens sp.]MCX9086982.1 hypothetical protein [Candidatus Methanoperedens sp.]